MTESTTHAEKVAQQILYIRQSRSEQCHMFASTQAAHWKMRVLSLGRQYVPDNSKVWFSRFPSHREHGDSVVSSIPLCMWTRTRARTHAGRQTHKHTAQSTETWRTLIRAVELTPSLLFVCCGCFFFYCTDTHTIPIIPISNNGSCIITNTYTSAINNRWKRRLQEELTCPPLQPKHYFKWDYFSWLVLVLMVM